MGFIAKLAVLMGASWASGINLYLTVAGLGLAHRLEWICLPGDLAVIAHPAVIILATVLLIIEFLADKIPYVDSVWDSVHTVIRPAAGAVLGYLVVVDAQPLVQMIVILLAAGISLDSHLTKSTARAAINASPEPVSNSVASVAEDASVIGVLYLIIAHPLLAVIVVVLFVLFSVWFLRKMYVLMRKVVRRLLGRRPLEGTA
jgi:hypothetical protein